LVHKPRLYTSYNIPSLASHWLRTWNFMQSIKYYRTPCSISISSTLNHKLWLRCILHPLIWVSSQLHFYSLKLSYVIMPYLKSPNPYFTPYHLFWYKRLVPCKSFFCSQNSSI
jgi:hypothetical protein